MFAEFLRTARLTLTVLVLAWMVLVVEQAFQKLAPSPYSTPSRPYVSVAAHPGNGPVTTMEAVRRWFTDIVDVWRYPN